MNTSCILSCTFIIIIAYCSRVLCPPPLPPPQWYTAQRDAFIEEEADMRLGADLTLNAKEVKVNKMLMALKDALIEKSRTSSHLYPPSIHYFKVKKEIDKSEIFKLIQKMPKGGALHIHSEAMTSLQWVVENMTYDPDIYSMKVGSGARRYRFAKEIPGQGWQKVNEERKSNKNPKDFDDRLVDELSIWTEDPARRYPSVNDVWVKFNKYFESMFDLLSHTDHHVNCIMRGIEEFFIDGVQYLELRITTQEEQLFDKLFQKIEAFKNKHPSFIGVKFIITKPRFFNNSQMLSDVKETMKMMRKYPDFVIGFDLVGQEDIGKTLLEYANTLLFPSEEESVNLPFFFHAGETDWTQSTDMNLVDAILLNTTRIGHGFAALRHPKIMDVVRKRKIAIELNPLSNQVLGLVSDLRNHPGTIFFAHGDPVVISSDDPPVWNASPMSHDFYMAFMALAGAKDDLRLLKQLALNSILYSTMTSVERDAAIAKWSDSWDAFIDDVIDNIGTNTNKMASHSYIAIFATLIFIITIYNYRFI